jgi:glyoxylase I family protein
MIQSIDHIELIVRDLEPYVEFYRKLGFRELARTEHHGGSVELQLPGDNQPVLEIHQVIGEETIGINHIAFRVASVDASCEEMRSLGIASGTPALSVPTGRTNVNLRDPDGWRVQLVDSERIAPA